ncbi:2-oxoglutarate and iron-dependent oxygenase domain-containing protein [Halomonas sp. PAMB 3264]|uniref:isopenicillin N synthase family dioxygenase n=1 Tax=Halomonas sp. PAMB 3264 TaxID=3075222 RepID=UPI00289DF77F|nr:2-oxoglutarate and iron-dependent oxygenase domain-containing protein [Halomonas sp. PAMB 3264]WNL42950.1 2-oxoglutarate and iron-dependent oxygenase domain-containing protein [Halomonas sp. PAMB 3264]
MSDDTTDLEVLDHQNAERARFTLAPSLTTRTLAPAQIPVIDLGPLLDQSDPMSVANAIGQACERTGFFYVRGHGIDPGLVEQAFTMAAGFFARPLAEKEALNIVGSGLSLRGYTPLFGENVDPNKSRDLKECFDLGLDEAEVSPFRGPNRMPAKPEAFKAVFERYYAEMLTLGHRLVGAIALSLGLCEDYFAPRQKRPIAIQRLLHYPSQAGAIGEEEIGIGAHTDYGLLTILAQDAVGGLQIRHCDGTWISAPPIDGAFVVNIGDLVQTLTNDRYVSTLHRVVNTSGRQRYSLPFFFDLDFEAMVEVLPSCTSESVPPRYAPYASGAHKFARYAASYTHLRDTSCLEALAE